MNSQVGMDEFIAMMGGAIQRVKDGEGRLSELDSACGDGDHGITMLRAVNRVNETLAKPEKTDFKSLVYDIGWTLHGVDGGATGPLLGTLFLGMSEALDGKESLDAGGLAQMFEQGLHAVEKQTKARVGDKTVMDALAPAVAALRAGADKGSDIPDLLQSAADAANQGANSTKDFLARFGKAKHSAERSLGHQDPGATSMAMIFRGFYEGFTKLKTA
jgi:phosphoenolpyruvate---glycerone phosphotransferase subunit DhaL